MSERDKLADEVGGALNEWGADRSGNLPARLATHIADSLIAAGYQKVRQFPTNGAA